jgi:2'-5' RNA ligase
MRSVMRCTGAFWSTVRLFVALRPPPEVVGLLAALPRPALPGVRWTGEDQWHVTLRFLGEADPAEAEAALRRTALPPRPTAELGDVVGRFGREILYVPVSGVEELAAAVVASTADVGEPPPDRPFTGHLTLARAQRGRGDVRAAVGARLQRTACWEVDEVTLVAGRLERSGARHSVVCRVPLPFLAQGA